MCVCVCVCICGVEKNYQSRVEAALDQALRVPFKIRGHVAGEKRNQAQTEEHQAANQGPGDRLSLKRRRRRRRSSRTHNMLVIAIAIAIGFSVGVGVCVIVVTVLVL